MARRRQKAGKQPAIKPPPSVLAAAAADPRTVWVLDVNNDNGRRIYIGSLSEVERWIDAYDGGPRTTLWLFPADTAWLRHKYGKLAERGWMRSGWYQTPDGMPADDGAFAQQQLDLAEQVDEWRRLASGQ